ncbi:hypothetical protein [Pseudomonas alkylphenolica]|uniref:Response regulator n=1 Tax=Pseudomonas alkylphenolica TaxID=237609 RepID=A0A077FGM8_9PSED|nr:hypothetical protein [Pseudomonas alkylphenolica]AIL63630.1 Response regulator [Pseudomonas alkylphenolica]
MKSATFRLDRRIFELFQDEALLRFTTRELRDAYVRELASPPKSMVECWRYIHDQIRRLIRVGWVRAEDSRAGRGKTYRVLTQPEHLTLDLVDRYSSEQPARADAVYGEEPVEESAVRRLKELAKEIRLDLLTSMGEAERYKQLMQEMPQLKEQVEDEFLEARDRGSRLLGHLKAVEKTLKFLSIA